ncbi:MFS transporter [Jatrophihabitans fulvus]
MTAAAAASARTRDLLRHRALRLLLLADVVDGTGSWAFNTVYALVVFEATGSAAWISIALAVRWIPALLLGPFAGVVADRYPRSAIMIASAVGSATVMGVLAGCVALDVPLAVVLVLSAVQASISTMYSPAFASALPDVVPERMLAAANGLREIGNNVTVIGGPALGTLLLLTGDPALGIAFNALTYLVPVFVLLRLRVESRGGGEAGANPFAELVDGVRALVAQRTAFVLFVAMVLDSGLAAVATALALPMSEYVGSGTDYYGYLLVANALGCIVAAGLAGRLASRRKLAGILVVALLLQATPFALLVALPNTASAFVLLLVSGAGMIVVDLVAITALQRDVPGAYLGRIFGMLDTSVFTASLLFALLGGALVTWIGTGPALLVVGIGGSVAVLACVPVLVATDRRSAARAAELAPVVDLLAALELFDGADRPALERLAIAAEARDVPAGTTVITEGEAAEDIWLLASGELAVSSAAVPGLPTVHAPGYVGEIGVLHERPRTATVTAAVPCRLYRLSGTDFRDALEGRAASSSLVRLSGERLARTEPARRHSAGGVAR